MMKRGSRCYPLSAILLLLLEASWFHTATSAKYLTTLKGSNRNSRAHVHNSLNESDLHRLRLLKGGKKGKGKTGKLGGKGSMGKFGKSGSLVPSFCESLDFRPPPSDDCSGKGRGKGGGKGRGKGGRELQYGGELCDPNVLAVAKHNPDLSIFVDLIQAAGLEDIFLCPGPFTALIPTNAAFESLDPNIIYYLMDPKNSEVLREVMLYHILPGFTYSSDFTKGPVETLQGEDVMVRKSPLMFNDAKAIEKDILACNGGIDTIDNVLIPPSLAPLPPGLCKNYDFSGDSFSHRDLQMGGKNCDPNIVATASENPDLSIFVRLVRAAGLESIFSCPGPFTALIPNNAAFEAIDPATIYYFLDPVNKNELQQVLLYHILPGLTYSKDFTQGPTSTLQGENVDVTLNPLMFNDAGVIQTDINACNGLIDIINNVLVPPSFGPSPSAPPITPTMSPTGGPTTLNTEGPTMKPVTAPPTTPGATAAPTRPATNAPIAPPTSPPTAGPTVPGATARPTVPATTAPSSAPSTTAPSAGAGTPVPSQATATKPPTAVPTVPGSGAPSISSGTAAPSLASSTAAPSVPTTTAPTGIPVVASSEPSQVPTSAPTQGGQTAAPTTTFQQVRVTDYFIAYNDTNLPIRAPTGPTEEQYNNMITVTSAFFTKRFEDLYANNDTVTFEGLNISIDYANNATKFLQDIPNATYQVYINFDTVLYFSRDTNPVPGPSETFVIMRDSDFTDYILNYVRTVEPFEGTTGVVFQAVELIGNVTNSIIARPAKAWVPLDEGEDGGSTTTTTTSQLQHQQSPGSNNNEMDHNAGEAVPGAGQTEDTTPASFDTTRSSPFAAQGGESSTQDKSGNDDANIIPMIFFVTAGTMLAAVLATGLIVWRRRRERAVEIERVDGFVAHVTNRTAPAHHSSGWIQPAAIQRHRHIIESI